VARSLNTLDEYSTVGALGAEALTDKLKANSTVAVSWGSTLQSVVNAIEGDYLPGVHLVPLVGGMTALSAGSSGDDLIRNMALKLSANHSAMLAPVVVSSPQARDAFIHEPSIGSVLEQAASADIAIVGIGSKRSSSSMDLLQTAGLDDATYDTIVDHMAGDLAARFFDINGQALDHGWADRIIGLDLDQIRRIPYVIGVAAGAGKAAGVIGAVRGGYLSEVVLSSACALAIVRQLDNEQSERAS
jgi:DNA-binding transcriptional regulator LsrR (DeoR family)